MYKKLSNLRISILLFLAYAFIFTNVFAVESSLASIYSKEDLQKIQIYKTILMLSEVKLRSGDTPPIFSEVAEVLREKCNQCQDCGEGENKKLEVSSTNIYGYFLFCDAFQNFDSEDQKQQSLLETYKRAYQEIAYRYRYQLKLKRINANCEGTAGANNCAARNAY